MHFQSSFPTILVLAVALCSGTSPLTNYVNLWEEELEAATIEQEEATFMAGKEYESKVSPVRLCKDIFADAECENIPLL